MPNPVTTIAFRFDQEQFSKNGIFFRGSVHLLLVPEAGEEFDLDRPAGMRGRVVRKEVTVTGRFTEVILHCEIVARGQAGKAKLAAFQSLSRWIRLTLGKFS